MQSHGPKRIYTPQSLEFWFSRMDVEWEGQFDSHHVERGHAMYRDSEIREVELGARDAIIHRRVDKKEEYAVIEWEGDSIKVRSSSTDALLANAIAVAGLHEIEELLVDEINALLPGGIKRNGNGEAKGHAANGQNGPNGHGHAPHNGNGNGHAAPAASNGNGAKPADANAPARDLLLSFTANNEGLVFLAFWKNGRNRIPALGNTAHHPTATERAKLIALATYARKAHFRYNQTTHAYALDALADIPGFLRDLLPHWKKQFAIELDVKVDNIKQGARVLEIEAVANRRPGSDGGLDLRWIFRAGEKLLTDEQAAALLKHGRTPMLLPDLGIVTISPEKWESYQQWKRNLEETQVDGEIPPYLIFSLFNDHRIKVILGPEIETWRQKVMTAPTTPPFLPEYLRNYQRRGVEWMHHLCETGCHGLLADEMGLGKTAQMIALLRSRPMVRKRHIVVCPASVVPVWRDELLRFYPDAKVETLKSGHDFKGIRTPCIWLASYTQLRKHRALLDHTDFGYAILDEGQFIKNPDAKVTQACFALKAEHRLVMTGTPLENRQLDLWSIFRYLLPGLLGSRTGFESALVQDRDGTMNRLRQQVAPFILRRTKNEVATELPPKVEMDLLCPLTEVQRAEYARICTEGLARLGEDIGLALREKSFGFLALLTRLRQVCCDPDLLPWLNSPLSDSGKLTLLIEKLQEVVASGHKVVIFSQFVTLLDRVRAALIQHYPELQRFEITGMTVDRQKPVKDFQTAQGAAAMLVSLKAAGTGITLHAADYVFLLDPWWNPAVEDQAIDRVHRIGQTNTVFVYRMVTAGTIEERIQALKGEKKQLFNQVVGGHGGDFEWTKHFNSLNSLIQLSAVETAEPEPPIGPVAPAAVAAPVASPALPETAAEAAPMV